MGQKIINIIDSHTGGEPTRVIVNGGPELEGNSPSELLKDFRKNYDHFRSAVVNEPRGSDVVVGALTYPPLDPTCLTGIIFFNNVGYLGMCGHGTIGLMVTLNYLNNLKPGEYRIETPVGIVTAKLHSSGEVSFINVPSYRYQKNLELNLTEYGKVTGDIAWGGNWFYLIQVYDLEIEYKNISSLTRFSSAVRSFLNQNNIRGKNDEEIDHIELFGPSKLNGVNSKNFVLCPGMAYDRSPCGTGTSARLACLFDDGKIKEGEIWKQESIVGSVFEGWVDIKNNLILTSIKGRAFITAESKIILDDGDPFKYGIGT